MQHDGYIKVYYMSRQLRDKIEEKGNKFFDFRRVKVSIKNSDERKGICICAS